MDGVDEDAIAGGVDGSSAYLQGTQGGVGNGNLLRSCRVCWKKERTWGAST